MHATKFALGLPGVTPVDRRRWDAAAIARGVIAVAQKADQLGYHHVSCADHIVVPESGRHFQGFKWYNPFAVLGFVAGATQRLGLLTGNLALPYRSPFLVAKAMSTLDVLSRGRAIMGVGIGHYEPQFQVLGIPYAGRGAVADEALGLIRRLWTEDAVTHSGRFFHCTEMVLDPKPVQKPLPVWIAGNGKAAARAAFTKGDGWLPYVFDADEHGIQAEHGREAARRAGVAGPIDVMGHLGPIHLQGSSTPTVPQDRIEKQAREATPGSEYYTRIARRNLDPSFITGVDQALESIERLRQNGATHCTVNFRAPELPGLLEAIDWFAEEVMPKA